MCRPRILLGKRGLIQKRTGQIGLQIDSGGSGSLRD